MVLIGCRDLQTLQEVDPEQGIWVILSFSFKSDFFSPFFPHAKAPVSPLASVAVDYGWQPARRFPFRSLAEVLEAARQLQPSEQEGFVACDGSFHRLKIKCDHLLCLAFLAILS